ncbi:MAG TPA: diguanylate cyclase, partial [Anaeromyxobacteraceae bacterium]|nr:diguanylate cyclase [Anaeromyxobacteraceae bacterium]
GKVSIDAVPYLAIRMALPGTDWSLVSLRRVTMRQENRGLGILITLLMSLVVVGAFVLLQRQLGAESAQVRKRREAEGKAREASRRADTDALTGVPNRQAFNDALAREFARARRFRQPLSVVLVDLDHFKRVNDEHGHAAGDQVLTGAARLLESRVRESDLAARWGGEEFAIIASMTDAAGAVRLAEKLRGMLEVTHMGPPVRVTASFGVAELRPDDGVDDLIRRADEALYRAKQEGRNRVACAEAWVDMDVVALAEALRKEGEMAGKQRVYMDTGYAPIDAEHRALSAGLDQLIDRVNGGKADEVLPVLSGVVRAVGSHFAHEESLMREHGYADRARHAEAHLLFVGDVKRFQAELERHGVSDEFRRWAVSRLPEWFRYHILAHDVALGKFLVKATAQPAGVPGAGRKEGVPA